MRVDIITISSPEQVVNVLYQENDWVYVIAEHGQQEGFIPHSYCAPYGSQLGELTINHKVSTSPD